MDKRAIQFFFAAVLFVLACRTLFSNPHEALSLPRTPITLDVSVLKAGHEYLSIPYINAHSKAANKHTGFPPYFPTFEKEETADEDESPVIYNQQRDLAVKNNEVSLVTLLKQPDWVSIVALFILFHTWKHFLF